ncbi:phage integrase N-terminal SAM-like domain-containing protein, partial [Vibrio parahaemolyticus]|nr:phage integrase N-terminal SAM-like domain-containing protein [Vibrio parahaemolyticus]
QRLTETDHMLPRYYANTTTESYLVWIKRFIVLHQFAHPSKLSEDDVIRFLSHLAIDEKVAVKNQELALNAISFLY